WKFWAAPCIRCMRSTLLVTKRCARSARPCCSAYATDWTPNHLVCWWAGPKCAVSMHNAVPWRPPTMVEVKVGQVWEQVSKHERGMQLEVVRDTGRRWVLRPVGGGPSKKRGLREGLWTLSTEQINATCRLVRDVD